MCIRDSHCGAGAGVRIAAGAEPCPLADASAAQNGKMAAALVSYTHLDVYKRQVLIHIFGRDLGNILQDGQDLGNDLCSFHRNFLPFRDG